VRCCSQLRLHLLLRFVRFCSISYFIVTRNWGGLESTNDEEINRVDASEVGEGVWRQGNASWAVIRVTRRRRAKEGMYATGTESHTLE
jgi:hypothetical protein